ncbi:class F sortase [Tessaracoccus sp. MC1627]|uniref:class F sortase n=1 Tax=Tessaracoccus sp. MC1627 TaxID=2760312 RepID=UPI0015FEF57E|nr:class F sortase [Tessaracoccus sp. MC1627]MBB1513760.1 class F sortase [Tessaracoccus sp. MC1627]
MFIYLSQESAPLPTRAYGPVVGTEVPVADAEVSASTPMAVPPQASTGAVVVPQLDPHALSIPSLGITAPLDVLGVEDNQLVLPEPERLTLFKDGSYPGDPQGTVLVAGHVNSYSLGRGALFHLAEINEGATIWVTDATGRLHEYRVVGLQLLSREALPRSLFSRLGDPRLVVVTCGGDIVNTPEGRHYESNVIVTAVPVGGGTADG